MEAPLIEKLTVVFAKKRVGDFLSDFDKLHIKRIHPDQAVRALSACGAVLSKAEQEQIMAAYTTGDGLFDYERLIEDVNNTRGNGFFEKRPEVDPSTTTPTARFGLTGLVASTATCLLPRAALSPEEEVQLVQVLNQARHEAHTRAIILARYMKQYDVTHTGIITASRFRRELLTCFRLLRPADADLLAKAYAAPDGQVRYMALHQDVTPDEPVPVPVVHRSVSPNARLFKAVYGGGSDGPGARARTMDAAKDIMAVLVRQFSVRRVRSTDIFRGYDRANSGRIPRACFIRGIGSCKLDSPLSLQELETLADAYVDLGADADGGFVRWRDFCDDVEAAEYLRPTLVQLEKEPDAHNSTFARAVMSGPPPGSERPDLTSEPEQRAMLFAVMSDIRATIQRYRLWRIADMLIDFDILHEGHLTVDRFLRVLAMCSCAPTRAPEKAVLLRYFGGEGSKLGMVNYRAFLAEVDLKAMGVAGA